LKRRRVVRAVLGWGILSFAVLQIYEPVMHGLHLPEWTLTLVVVILGVGFPATFVLAWIFDMGPGGVERTPSTPASATTPGRRIRTGLLLVGLGALFAIPGWVWYARYGRAAVVAPPVEGDAAPARPAPVAPTGPSIAVLPFADMSPGHDQEYFADGVAEEIRNALVHVEGLRVPGRTSSFWFKGKDVKLQEIGRELRVDHVLEGSVRRAGNRVRVTAQVVSVADGGHLWSEAFDGAEGDIFTIQERVAKAVVEALKVKLVGGRDPEARGRATVNPEAYAQYLLGMHFYLRGSTDGIQRGREAFEKSIALDPGFALPHVWLGAALRDLSAREGVSPQESRAMRDRFLPEVERAIALAPEMPDGYDMRALQRLAIQRDWAGALADANRALALSPGDATAHRRRGQVLAAQGRFSDAIAEVRRAGEIDPLNLFNWTWLGMFQLAAGQIDDAETSQRRALEISPDSDDAWTTRATVRLLQGRPDEALEFAARIGTSDRLVFEAIANHELGREKESREALARLHDKAASVDPEKLAAAYAWLGDADQAFRWLERSLDVELWDVKFNVLLQKLHGDPRWAAMLRRMNLPPD